MIEQVATDVFGIVIPEESDGANAEFLLDNRNGKVRAGLLPFMGGVPDASQIIFEVNNGGGTFGPRIAQSTGFKWAVTGGDFDGWELYALDLQENKYNVPDFYGEGWLLAYRFAKADAPVAVGGEIRIDKLILSGDYASYKFIRQPSLPQWMIDQGSEQPLWCVESYAVQSIDKRNNVKNTNGTVRNAYRSGKAGHIVRPRIELLDGATRKGGVWGRFEKTPNGNGTVLITKVFDEAEVQAKIAEVGGANFTHFAVDAIIGYDTTGGTKVGLAGNSCYFFFDGENAAHRGFIAPENGTINSLHMINAAAMSSTYKHHQGLYTYDGIDTVTFVPNAQVAGTAPWTNNADNSDLVVAGKYDNWSVPASAASFSSGDELVHAADPQSTIPDIYADASTYDSWGASTGDFLNATDMETGFSPYTILTFIAAAFNFNAWIDYTSATSPPVTTNTAVDPASVPQGDDSGLSADITDADHTITAAEYFIGADPGEGSGTAMSLGAGTTSREATATIDTSGLDVDDHTVSVRGFDATDGWGDVDTATLTVTEAPAGGRVVGLIAGVGRMMGA